MNEATPASRTVARALLEHEAATSDQEIFSAVEKLRIRLSKLLGVNGFQAILNRALVMARAEAPWLDKVQIRPDGTLEGIGKLGKEEGEQSQRGSEALLAHMLGLLIVFIGEDLTLRLVRDVWPDLRMNDLDIGSEEGSS